MVNGTGGHRPRTLHVRVTHGSASGLRVVIHRRIVDEQYRMSDDSRPGA